jgi:site-specific DNA recombinase
MKSIALYARVSSDRQAQQATIDSQIAALNERAVADGHAVLPDDVYVDDGYSGSSLRRPALERLRDRIAEAGLDLLYVLSPDRLARRYAYQVLLLEELAALKVEVVFLQGRAGETPEDQLLVQVQGVIAEYERAKILERSRRGKLHQARKGLVNPLASAPYGYLYVKKTDCAPASYQIVLHEAKVVREIFEAVVNEQLSLRQITRRLNDRQIPPPGRGPRWKASRIQQIVINSAYMGKAAFGKTETIERPTLLRPVRNRNPLPRNKNNRRRRPQDEWTYIDVPPIVSAEVFAAAQEQMERNKRLAQRNATAQRYLLRGLVVCARCGYGFHGKSVSRKPRTLEKLFYYRCTGRVPDHFGGKVVCDNMPVRVDLLEQHVWRSVCELLQEPDRLRLEWERRCSTDTSGIDQQKADALRVVQAHERALQRLLDAYEAGVLQLDELKTRSESVRKRCEQARQELLAIQKLSDETSELRAVVAKLEDFARHVRQGLDRMPFDDRQKLFRTLIARVEIDKDDVTIVYRIPRPSDPRSDGPTGPRSPDSTPSSGSASGGPGAALTPPSSLSATSASGEIVDCVPPVLGAARLRAYGLPPGRARAGCATPLPSFRA